MRIHEYIRKSMRLVLVVTAFIIAGSAASQLCAAVDVPSEPKTSPSRPKRVRQSARSTENAKKASKKQSKKTAKKQPTKKATKKSKSSVASKKAAKAKAAKTEAAKVDKVVVAPSELEIIKQDTNQGKWEEYSRSDEKLAIDNIAVGPNGVLYGVDKETKNFYQHDGKDWILKKAGDVKFITVAMDGSVLLLSENGGVFLYKDGAITPVAESKYDFDSIAAFSVNDIYGIVNDEGFSYGKLYHLMNGTWDPVLAGSFMSMITSPGKRFRGAKGVSDVFITSGRVCVIGFDGNAWYVPVDAK